MLGVFGFAPAETPCKENAAAKKTRTVVDVEEPARKSLAELDAERRADCERMSQLWGLPPMPKQPKYRQTAQNIWTLGIYEFIRQISPKQADEPEPCWVPLNKPDTIPAKGLTPN